MSENAGTASRQAFPSLLLRHDGVTAQGSFAEQQAAYLEPDPNDVSRLRDLLEANEAGLVAHFYMDAELQGVLFACDWPHIHVSDSLLMADSAIEMARAGIKKVIVLGVDFMSENVRAMLDDAGFTDVKVYRVAEAEIGCSLAAAAEALEYGAYLTKASKVSKSLHVVYINTSLRTKAQAQHLVPTITCTSSNVVRTVLQAFAQEPETRLWFGPDTYMGENLRTLFEHLVTLDDAAVQALHPEHSVASIKSLLDRFTHFGQGNCVVHHMFGEAVVTQVREDYPDAFVTAHLEVPGEMFALANLAQAEGRGVVGSTSNILNYISEKVEEAGASGRSSSLRFILGTEAGMVSAIVRRLRRALEAHPSVEVEIIFPVASEAIAVDPTDALLPVIPGVAGGEGCSTAGGCATCPYMKMNTLEATFDVLERCDRPEKLVGFEPEKYSEQVGGQSVAQLGTLPILNMRDFQRSGRLSDSLLEDMRTRVADAN
jgi:quinolinate synthase